MIKLLSDSQRRHVRRGKQEVWRSFFAEDPRAPFDSGFGFLFAFKVLPTIVFFGGFMAVL